MENSVELETVQWNLHHLLDCLSALCYDLKFVHDLRNSLEIHSKRDDALHFQHDPWNAPVFVGLNPIDGHRIHRVTPSGSQVATTSASGLLTSERKFKHCCLISIL